MALGSIRPRNARTLIATVLAVCVVAFGFAVAINTVFECNLAPQPSMSRQTRYSSSGLYCSANASAGLENFAPNR